MKGLELREGDRAAFFEAPFAAYGRETPFVSPMRSDLFRYLDERKNPLFREDGGVRSFWTAHRSGLTVGRIVAHVHPASNRRHGWNRAFFGFFDCASDPDAAAALTAAAENFGRRHGCTEIIGNFNLTAMQQIGVLTEGFEAAPYTDMIYGPPHLPLFLEQCGYERIFPVSTFEFTPDAVDVGELLGPRQSEILASPDWRFAPVTRRLLSKRLAEARACLNDGFHDNPMFVPLTDQEFRFQAGEMMWILDPRLSTVAHWRGEPAGVVICIPDLNPLLKTIGSRLSPTTPLHFLKHRLTRDRAVIIYYAVRRALHGRGLAGAMLHRVVEALKKGGYHACGVTWVGDSNAASLRQLEKLGARRLHRLHLFRKALA